MKKKKEEIIEPIYSAPQPQQRKAPTASWRLMNNNSPVPIAPPADFIQLTPIVQPIPLVPYSSQLQPLLTFEEFED